MTGESEPLEPDVPGGSETILLVEDAAAVRQVARQVLERFGSPCWKRSTPVVRGNYSDRWTRVRITAPPAQGITRWD